MPLGEENITQTISSMAGSRKQIMFDSGKLRKLEAILREVDRVSGKLESDLQIPFDEKLKQMRILEAFKNQTKSLLGKTLKNPGKAMEPGEMSIEHFDDELKEAFGETTTRGTINTSIGDTATTTRTTAGNYEPSIDGFDDLGDDSLPNEVKARQVKESAATEAELERTIQNLDKEIAKQKPSRYKAVFGNIWTGLLKGLALSPAYEFLDPPSLGPVPGTPEYELEMGRITMDQYKQASIGDRANEAYKKYLASQKLRSGEVGLRK